MPDIHQTVNVEEELTDGQERSGFAATHPTDEATAAGAPIPGTADSVALTPSGQYVTVSRRREQG